MLIASIERAARKVCTEPDAEFRRLALIGGNARTRGCYTRAEFLQVCRWKSTRHIGLCMVNSDREVRAATHKAFAARSERSRIEALTALVGVAVPTASALLAVANPMAFGVIDIRAWQFMHSARVVTRNKSGRGLSVNNWLEYLPVLRSVAKTVGTSPRLVEIALYQAHKRRSKAPLYGIGQAPNPSFKRTCLRHAA